MSYFSIKDFISSGRKSLKDKNYWSALSVALMLPSMCSRLQFKNNSDYYEEKGKILYWKDRKCYIDWCNLNFNKNDWLKDCLDNSYSEILYQLRCDIVHAGCANIYTDEQGIYLLLGEYTMPTMFTKYKIIDIKSLCECIFDAVEFWCSNSGASNFKYTFVFDSENRDDMLLYNRLHDKDRSDYLEEQFLKNEEERRKEL